MSTTQYNSEKHGKSEQARLNTQLTRFSAHALCDVLQSLAANQVAAFLVDR